MAQSSIPVMTCDRCGAREEIRKPAQGYEWGAIHAAQAKRDPDYPRKKGWRKRDGAFPERTCPASRHTALIADSLRDFHSPLRRLLIDAGYEPDHMASSIESTCMSVWRHRRFLRWDAEAKDWLPSPETPND